MTAPCPIPTETTSPGYPGLVLSLQLPRDRGHDACGLIRQIDACLLADAERASVLCDGVDAKTSRERVVEGIAGVRDGIVDIDEAVMPVAGMKLSEEDAPTLTVDMHGLGTFSCRPATDMMILNVLPGASWAWMVLLSRGWSGLLRIPFQ